MLYLFLLSFLAFAVSAKGAGRIEGRILDAENGKPLAYANVVLLGTAKGAMSQADGGFAITPLDAGSYELQVSFVGYETVKQTVQLEEGQTLTVTFRLRSSAVRTREVTIKADRPLVDVKRASTIRTFNESRAQGARQPADARQRRRAATRRHQGQRSDPHPRRTGRRDPLHRRRREEARPALRRLQGHRRSASRSVAEVNIITGGFDAKYGQALSGIVEAKLKEGTEQFHGYFGYATDRGIDDQKVDLFDFQISGPLQVMHPRSEAAGRQRTAERSTFFLDLSADLSNG